MFTYLETHPLEIREKYRHYYHEKARYFRIARNAIPVGYYGIIPYDDKTCEAFLMFKSFQGKVLSRDFFIALFNHSFSLGYKEIYTWTKWDRLIKLFGHFKKFGIEPTNCPPWDKDWLDPTKAGGDPCETKTWFVRRM